MTGIKVENEIDVKVEEDICVKREVDIDMKGEEGIIIKEAEDIDVKEEDSTMDVTVSEMEAENDEVS